MEELRFVMKGSTQEPRHVVVRKDGQNLTMLCSCSMGSRESMCKHRIDLLTGATQNILSGNPGDVQRVAALIEGTDVQKALRMVRAASAKLQEAQEEYEFAQKNLIKAIND
jgi:hypothetical protein